MRVEEARLPIGAGSRAVCGLHGGPIHQMFVDRMSGGQTRQGNACAGGAEQARHHLATTQPGGGPCTFGIENLQRRFLHGDPASIAGLAASCPTLRSDATTPVVSVQGESRYPVE